MSNIQSQFGGLIQSDPLLNLPGGLGLLRLLLGQQESGDAEGLRNLFTGGISGSNALGALGPLGGLIPGSEGGQFAALGLGAPLLQLLQGQGGGGGDFGALGLLGLLGR